jgi:hypothetical protein
VEKRSSFLRRVTPQVQASNLVLMSIADIDPSPLMLFDHYRNSISAAAMAFAVFIVSATASQATRWYHLNLCPF